MNNFHPTHRIVLDLGETIPVLLLDGAAYTREEWEAESAADYERDDDGDWLFQGQPFAGYVQDLDVIAKALSRYHRGEGRGDDSEIWDAWVGNQGAADIQADHDWTAYVEWAAESV